MNPNFKSISDRNQNQQQLIRDAQRDAENERAKEQLYKKAMWASDIEANRIDVSRPMVENSTQTNSFEDRRGASHLDQDRSSLLDSNSVFSITDVNPTSGNPTSGSPMIITSSSISTQTLQNETDLMMNEDYLSDLMRHQDYISDQRDTINRKDNQIREGNAQLRKLNNQIQLMQNEFKTAELQFRALLDDNDLSKRQIQALYSDFELGRQLYLNLQQKAETLAYERDLSKAELEDFKLEYSKGEELYNALSDAYKVLQEDASIRTIKYEELIQDLRHQNAEATARVLELQQQMLKSTVSESTARNTRSYMNTPAALREFMEERNITETAAAVIAGTISKTGTFLIKNGQLYYKNTKWKNKDPVNLEDGSQKAQNALLPPFHNDCGINKMRTFQNDCGFVKH